MAMMAQSLSGTDHETAMDANALLTDLDKGLRSPRPGEQCEAIVRFPSLFQRYPFPILINSASLKLADLFRNGSNFCRLLILKVIEQSEKHLDKISNADEFVRRLFAVSYSNDPVARAVTLRALAAIASIAADRKNIHHCIRDRLDSHDEIEVSAAIDAAAAYAEKSEEFALNIYPKVISMIHRLETLPELKIRLLTVLHHSHYDPRLALQVRENCVQLLTAFPSEKFVCAAFSTLTLISAASLSQIPSQISLLLCYFVRDDRHGIKRQALKEILSLSKSCPHLWSESNLMELVSTAEKYADIQNKNKRSSFYFSELMNIMCQLIKCPCLLSDSESGQGTRVWNDRVVKLCLRVVYGNYELTVISLSFSILASICETSGDREVQEATVCAVQAFIMSIASEEHSDCNRVACARSCKTLVRLSKLGDPIRDRIVTSLRFALLYGDLSDSWLMSTAETISAIAHTNDCEDFAVDLEQFIIQKKGSSDQLIVALLTVYFQTLLIASKSCEIDIIPFLNGVSFWTCYQIVRQAIRYGHHSIANILCNRMHESASSDICYFWMQSLAQITGAESCLYQTQESDLDESLSRAIALYVESSSCLKSMVTVGNPLTFQNEYLQLRLKYLQAHEQLRQSCKLVRTSPAPAIAASTAQITRDELMKYGAIVTQMRKSAQEFRILSGSYSNLFQSSFNADNQTLAHMQLMQSSCTMIAEAIESLFQTNRGSSLIVDKNTHLENTQIDTGSEGPAIEHLKLIQVCHKISSTVSRELSGRNCSKIEHNHIQILERMSLDLLSVPLSIPRLFFQSIQSVSIKLAISPQPKMPGELMIVMSSMSFALKVEGVIVTSQSPHLKHQTRSVAKVMLNVTTNPVTSMNGAKNQTPEAANYGNAGLNLNSVVVAKNDYFSTQFLLNFGASGVHTITVEASIIDENEAQWKSGHVVTSSVKVVDDGIK
jgi:integrator complex subunit 7